MALRRYACPNCGSGLSRTVVHPKWLTLESGRPEFHMPLGRMLAAIIVLGIGLALVHPLLGFVGVLALLGRIYWRYFSWLQCDSCSRFYFGGQLSSSPRATIPWTKSDIQNLALRVSILGGILLLVFLPLRYVEQTARNNCAAECALAGRDGQAFFNRCNCVPRAK